MRNFRPLRHLLRWGARCAAIGLISLAGVWVSAQDATPRTVPNREQVPSVAQLTAQLVRLRRDNPASAGGPALEHAALALTRAREAESAEPAGNPAAAAEALRARRIAYAALALAGAQRDREHARILRNEAAEARRDADGAARTAEEALRVAQANAAAAQGASSASGAAPTPSTGTPPADGAATELVPPGASAEAAP